jgi:putative transposase
VGLSRSGYYYEPVPESEENLALMRRLDELNLAHPVYGSRRLRALLAREGCVVNRKRVVRLLGLLGIEAVYPKRHLSQPGEGHRIYPYLLEGLEITGPDQVWCSDITYVPMARGYMYLVAVMDWWSRYVVAWELSNSMDSEFCIRAWNAALAQGRTPLIANTDQGSQFTSEAYLEAVESAGVDVSMDGRGRWIDNRFIERLWRSVKQEDIYVQDYGDGLTAQRGLAITIRSVHTKRWNMPRLGNGITRRNRTGPSRPRGDGNSRRGAPGVQPSVRPFAPDGAQGLTPGWTPEPRSGLVVSRETPVL